MEAVKIGILGCGGIARSKHLPELQKIEGVEIIGFYDPIKSRAQECAEKFGNHAKVYETAGELLDDPGIDAVHICCLLYTSGREMIFDCPFGLSWGLTGEGDAGV